MSTATRLVQINHPRYGIGTGLLKYNVSYLVPRRKFKKKKKKEKFQSAKEFLPRPRLNNIETESERARSE